mgnify:CR=1 FL=1
MVGIDSKDFYKCEGTNLAKIFIGASRNSFDDGMFFLLIGNSTCPTYHVSVLATLYYGTITMFSRSLINIIACFHETKTKREIYAYGVNIYLFIFKRFSSIVLRKNARRLQLDPSCPGGTTFLYNDAK